MARDTPVKKRCSSARPPAANAAISELPASAGRAWTLNNELTTDDGG